MKALKIIALICILSISFTTIFNKGDGIDFGIIPEVQNLKYITFTAKIKLLADLGDLRNAIVSIHGDGVGSYIFVQNGQKLGYVGNQNDGETVYTNTSYVTDSNVVPLNEWVNIAVTRHCLGDNIPKFYVNGIEYPVITQTGLLFGTLKDESSASLRIGNISSTGISDWSRPFNGEIKDVRIYNRVLTSDEIFDLHNGKNIVNGIVFKTNIVYDSKIK